jgi:DNA-binding LacI/PurR family transcriptional regulator
MSKTEVNKARIKRAPTMQDVADLAGVNRVTASVALRGARAGTHVSEATRQRILAAAQELGYSPNSIALALRRQRTDIIGVYMGLGYVNMYDPFTAAILNGLQRGCGFYQKDLFMYGGFQRSSPVEIYSALSSGKIDGLVTLPSANNPVVEKLAQSHLPAVAIANRAPSIPSLVVDDAGGSRKMADYLASKGHRRILYRGDLHSHGSPQLRQVAFRQRAAELGMDVLLTLPGDWEGGLSDEEKGILFSTQRPTAVVCWVDTHAYRCIEEATALGLKVPDDVAVVGFDGVKGRISPARNLTTIRAPWEQVGETAVGFLIKLIEGEEVEPEVVFPVELVIGDTA